MIGPYPPDTPSMTVMPLHIMTIYFSPAIPLFIYGIAAQMSQCITPQNPTFLTLHLPIPLSIPKLFQSQKTLMSSLPLPLTMTPIQTGIKAPHILNSS